MHRVQYRLLAPLHTRRKVTRICFRPYTAHKFPATPYIAPAPDFIFSALQYCIILFATRPATILPARRRRTTQPIGHAHKTHSLIGYMLQTCPKHGRGRISLGEYLIHRVHVSRQLHSTPAACLSRRFFVPYFTWRIRQGRVRHPKASGRGIGGHHTVSQNPPLGTTR
jgi:hypothetical protein